MDLGNYNKSVGSSILCKFSTLLYQIIAVPYCIKSISKTDFGVYSSILALNSLILLIEFGFGPIISKIAANAYTSNNTNELRKLFTNISVIAFTSSSILSLIISTLFIYYTKETIESRYSTTLIFIIGTISIIQATFMATYKIQLGIDQIYFYNISASIGNFVCAIFLILSTYTSPSVLNLALSLVINVLLINSINCFLIYNKNKYFIIDLKLLNANYYFSILTGGIGLSICYTEAHIVRELFKILNVNYIPIETLAKYSILIHFYSIFYGFVSSLITPLLPAVIKHKSNNETLKKIFSFSLIFISLFGLFFFLTFYNNHKFFINIIYGTNYNLSNESAYWFSLYIYIQSLQSIILLFLITLCNVKTFSIFFICNLILCPIFFLVLKISDLGSIFLCFCISSLIFVTVPSLFIIKNKLK